MFIDLRTGVWRGNGIGRHVAMRLLAAGEQVVEVPPKLSARARVSATGQGRKTDATDAHSVALVGTGWPGLRPVVNDEQLAVLRVLVDRRRSLGEEHTRKIAQLHQLLLELIPGGRRREQRGNGCDSSAAGSHPQADSSDKPLHGPPNISLEPHSRQLLDTQGSHERAVTTQRPQRSTRSQGQSVASQRATVSASGTSRFDLSAHTQDCTVTSHFSEAEGYR